MEKETKGKKGRIIKNRRVEKKKEEKGEVKEKGEKGEYKKKERMQL